MFIHYLPPARPGNLIKILWFVATGLSGLVQLHVKLSQLEELQEKFLILNGLSIQIKIK